MNRYGYDEFLKTKNDDNTANAYLGDLAKYELFLSSINAECETADQKTIKAFMTSLKEHGFKPATCARILVSVRAFYNYLIESGIVTSNPAENIRAPKINKSLPYILSIEEVDRFLSQPLEVDYRGIRDKAMLEVMYATGIKVSEVIMLNVSDVDFETGMVSCITPNKIRQLPIGTFALNAVASYLDKARPYMIASDKEQALFVNMTGMRLSRQGLWKIIKGYAKSSGITHNITPHSLRHSFALHLVERGANLRAVAHMLGHSDVSLTSRYLKATNKDTSRVYHELHPRA